MRPLIDIGPAGQRGQALRLHGVPSPIKDFPDAISTWNETVAGRRRIFFSDRPLGEDWIADVVEVLEPYVDVDSTVRDYLEAGREARAMSSALSTEFEVLGDLGGTLDPYQIVPVHYGWIVGGRFLIADDTGLGKTVESMAWAAHIDGFPLLIVCPPVLTTNWLRHVEHWLPGKTATLIEGYAWSEIEPADVYVAGYSVLHARKLQIASAVKPELVVFDEAHYLKNPRSQRTRAGTLLGHMAPSVVLLTATPLLNRPIELWPLLHVLFPDEYRNFHEFGVKYAGGKQKFFGRKRVWDYSGATDTQRLGRILRTRCMVRREKKDVLTALAEPRKATVFFPLGDKGQGIYEAALAEVRQRIDELEDPSAARRMEQARRLVETIVLRRLTAEVKVPPAIEWIREFLDGCEESLVVFAHHRIVIDALRQAVDGSEVITGETPKNERWEIIDRFQAGKTRVLIGSIGATGTGIDLTKASNCCFIELGWNANDVYQAASRLHRRGQENLVTEWYLLCDGTFEKYLLDLILKKIRYRDKILRDGETDKGFDVFREFLKQIGE